jgi:hypothetical protein
MITRAVLKILAMPTLDYVSMNTVLIVDHNVKQLLTASNGVLITNFLLNANNHSVIKHKELVSLLMLLMQLNVQFQTVTRFAHLLINVLTPLVLMILTKTYCATIPNSTVTITKNALLILAILSLVVFTLGNQVILALNVQRMINVLLGLLNWENALLLLVMLKRRNVLRTLLIFLSVIIKFNAQDLVKLIHCAQLLLLLKKLANAIARSLQRIVMMDLAALLISVTLKLESVLTDSNLQINALLLAL